MAKAGLDIATEDIVDVFAAAVLATIYIVHCVIFYTYATWARIKYTNLIIWAHDSSVIH